ncbi:MAG: cohesin domain-containing protein [Candidatus Methanoperedens sp.]|nr:cohesin domain-containing protein [Candidatus Methanoperedens sp.]
MFWICILWQRDLIDSSIDKDPERSRKQKRSRTTAAVVLIILIFSVYFIFNKSPGMAPFDDVRISIVPENSNILKGKEFYVDVFIDPGKKPVSAVQFNLFFNSSILKIKNVQEGDFLKINETRTIFSPGKINNTGGMLLNVFGTMVSPGGNTTVRSTFARITMSSEAPGSSGIEPRNVVVSGPDSKQYQVKILNGSIEVVE